MNINILFGSETGNAEGLANDAEKFLTEKGHTVTKSEMDAVSISDLKAMNKVLLITSTWGDGDAPSNATKFVDDLLSSSEDLSALSYAVFAIGSSSFPQFCQAGINIDDQFTKLGAKKIKDIVTADDDFSEFPNWIESISSTL